MVLKFKKGKKSGEQIEYLSKDKLNKEIKFFTNGKMDSLSRYIEGKLIQTKSDFDSLENNQSTRRYIYEDNKLIKVINLLDDNRPDTILINN